MNAFVAVLNKYLAGSETGQLVVQFAEVENLCKIAIENGQAVYLSLGNMSPEQTLEFITGKNPRKAKFIPGVPARKKLETPINDKLLAIAAGSDSKNSSKPLVADPPPLDVQIKGSASPQKIEELIEDFIDLVGPLGTILAQKSLGKLGCSKETEMPGHMYSAFLSMLHAEVPEDQQREFLQRHQK